MRIVIDMQGWQGSSRQRGIGRYSIAIVKELVKLSDAHEVVLTFNGNYKDSIKEFKKIVCAGTFDIKVWYPVDSTSFLYESNKWNRNVSEILYEEFHASLQPDFLLITSIFEGLIDHSVISVSTFRTFPVGVILYDLIPFIYKDIYLTNDVLKEWYNTQLDFLNKADFLFSISSSAGQEAVNYLQWDADKVLNVSTAADNSFFKIDLQVEKTSSIIEKYSLKTDFLMYTGGVDHRKNMEKLIESYSLLPEYLKEKHQLAIICSMPEHVKDDLYKLGEKFGLKNNQLILTGYVSDEELVYFYNLCHAFVFPSWHEGFGLPVLEAMLCGKPVITSNVSSLPEVIEFEEALFDPRNTNDIKNKIIQVLEDDEFRSRLIEHSKQQVKKFGWDISAEKLLNGIINFSNSYNNRREVINENSNEKKKKLAVISPLPPEKSGISYYCADLLPYLENFYQIVLVNDDEDVRRDWKKKNVSVITISDFKKSYHSYDRILYQFGNSHFHSHMFDLLNIMPGVVVMHDFYLSGVVNWMLHNKSDGTQINDVLYESHGYNAVRFNNDKMSNDDAILEYPCNISVLNGARGLIFHSENTLKLAEKWYGKLFKNKYHHIPLLREFVDVFDKKQARNKLKVNSDDLLIISLGFLASTKLNHKIIEAFNSLENKSSKIKLVFVGHNSKSDYGRLIDKLVDESPYKNSIKITDWVSDEEYKLWLSAADIGIQLRTSSRGETSAAVLDCMNYGLATIANANGSMSDLDPESIILLNDKFTDEEISSALHILVDDGNKRNELGMRARDVIRTVHSPAESSRKYHECIEETYSGNAGLNFFSYERFKDKLVDATDQQLKFFAQAISNSSSVDKSSTIYIDITADQNADDSIELNDVIINLSNSLPRHLRLEPIYFDGTYYKKANGYAQRVYHLSGLHQRDEIIDVVKNSHFIIYNPSPVHLLKIAELCHFIALDNRITYMLWEDDANTLEQGFNELNEVEVNSIIDMISLGEVICSDNLPESTMSSFQQRFAGAQQWIVKYLSPEMYTKQLLKL